MNVLLIIDGLGSGGAQRQMVNLAVGLKKLNYEVSIFCYHDEDHYKNILEKNNIPIFCAHKKSKFSVEPIICLRKKIINGNYICAISFLDTPNFYLELASINLKVKIIVSERFMYVGEKIGFVKWLVQQFHRRADAVTVNSFHQTKKMVKFFPWIKEKIHTIYNGYDLEEFNKKPKIKSKSSSIINFIAIASVSNKKNAIGLARAVKLCHDKYNIDIYVDWVGATSVSGEGDAVFLEVNEFLLNNNITHLWNWLGVRSDISSLIHNYTALIHPSFYEGLPNVVCEALACGKPVVVGDVCDHALLVKNGHNGYLFNPWDHNSIAESIYRIYTLSENELNSMEYNARQFAVNNLSINKYVSSYDELIKKLILVEKHKL